MAADKVVNKVNTIDTFGVSDEVQVALEYLLRTAEKHNAFVAGFMFSSEPMLFTNFGNCSDCGDIKLYTKLCNLADEKKEAGLVHKQIISSVQ